MAPQQLQTATRPQSSVKSSAEDPANQTAEQRAGAFEQQLIGRRNNFTQSGSTHISRSFTQRKAETTGRQRSGGSIGPGIVDEIDGRMITINSSTSSSTGISS